MRKKQIRYTVESAVIAALYAGLTYLSAFLGLAYGPIQLRFSEALTVLPLLTPAAVPGLAVGCFFSNLLSFNPLDLIFGTLATLLSAMLTYTLRRRGKWIALLPPVLINAVVIGAEIVLLTEPAQSGFWAAFVPSGLTVGGGQLISCYGLGIPLLMILKKYRLFGNE